MFNKISKYLNEVRDQLSKISWPSREELFGSVAVVLVLCIVLSIFVFGVDFIFSRLLDVVF